MKYAVTRVAILAVALFLGTAAWGQQAAPRVVSLQTGLKIGWAFHFAGPVIELREGDPRHPPLHGPTLIFDSGQLVLAAPKSDYKMPRSRRGPVLKPETLLNGDIAVFESISPSKGTAAGIYDKKIAGAGPMRSDMPDLTMRGRKMAYAIRVLWQDGSITDIESERGWGFDYCDIAIADIDGDGKEDVIVLEANADNNARIAVFSGASPTPKRIAASKPVITGNVTAGDLVTGSFLGSAGPQIIMLDWVRDRPALRLFTFGGSLELHDASRQVEKYMGAISAYFDGVMTFDLDGNGAKFVAVSSDSRCLVAYGVSASGIAEGTRHYCGAPIVRTIAKFDLDGNGIDDLVFVRENGEVTALLR